VWTDEAAFAGGCAELKTGPAVLRDYTKSMKHHWDEAAFIPDVADAAAAGRVASRFRELRGDDFTGGFVLRRFETWTGAEARTWWIGGEYRLVTAHPDTPAEELINPLLGKGSDRTVVTQANGVTDETIDAPRRWWPATTRLN
jgi:ATP-grasp domain, R2K clade family 3